MITKRKIIAILMFSLAFLLLSTVEPSVYAGSCEYNPGDGTYAHSHERIHQDQWPVANNLEFTVWQAESTVHISGYRVTIDCFPTVTCWWGDPGPEHHEVDVRAEGANVPNCDYCEIDVEFWLKPKWNTVRKKDIKWTYEVEPPRPGPPDHGWACKPGAATAEIIIFNDDATRSFTITGFEYHISTTYWPNLENVPFAKSIAGEFSLAMGKYRIFEVPIDIFEGHVYFHYVMLDAPGGNVLAEEWADHEMWPVGGIWVPINKLGLLAPYLGVASAVSISAIAAVIYVKRRKKR